MGRLLPADDGCTMACEESEIILPLTSQSLSYFIFKSNRKMMIHSGRILSYQIRKGDVCLQFIPTEIHSQIFFKSSF